MDPPEDPGEFLNYVDRLPPQQLSDMKNIVLGGFHPKNEFQVKLVELFHKDFEKFCARLERLQTAHDRKIEAMDALKAAELVKEMKVKEEKESPCEEDEGKGLLETWLRERT